MLKFITHSFFLLCISFFFGTKCDEDGENEKILRFTIAQKIIIKTCTPSKADAQYAFSSILEHNDLRPFLISISNNSDVALMFSKRFIDLNLTPDDQIYRSDIALFIPGFILFIAGCLDNIYIKALSLATSLSMLWKDYHTYIFFKKMLLTDNESVIINPHEQIQRIVVVDDLNFKGIFKLYLENIQGGYFQDFTIDITQNGSSDRSAIILHGANYA